MEEPQQTPLPQIDGYAENKKFSIDERAERFLESVRIQ
jgi:hypothetical protein